MAKSTAKSVPHRVFRRRGKTTQTEAAFVQQFVQDQPAAMTRGQLSALAKTMRRSPTTVKKLVERARENFASNAELYVDAHAKSVKGALEDRDFETASKAAQWGMEHLSFEGQRIVEKQIEGPAVPRVMIGIKLGGVDMDKVQALSLPVVDAEPTSD